MSRLLFFPAPYPDELFYSVLCRYHMRCGVPSTGATNREIGGFKIGQNVYLPQTIGRLSATIPPETGLSAEYFLMETTIFPYIKPFLREDRARKSAEILTSNKPENTRNATGFSRLELSKWKYLRYCGECWQDDLLIHGEAYWHRLHLIPGVMVCPIHGVEIMDSKVLIANITREFYPAAFSLSSEKAAKSHPCECAHKLIALSEDSAWLLRNGHALLPFEDTLERYLSLLCSKGFLNLSRTKTKSQELDAALRSFYGDTFLALLGIASNSNIPWSRQLFYKSGLSNPLWHLLLIRFLSGSAEAFFTQRHEKPLPYGSGPWPCRNPVCRHHLENTITAIEETYELSRFKAAFKCPHCGFVYCRSNGGQAELPDPRSVRIYMLEYGWLWESMMLRYLKEGVPVMKIMELMHCGYRTVMEFGTANGFFELGRVPKKYFYRKQDKDNETGKPSSANLRKLYRDQWKKAVASNPAASRTILIRQFPSAYQWLRKNDLKWYETNSPPSRKSQPDWDEKDVKCLKQVIDAFHTMLNIPGKPMWISIRAMERYAGITNLYQPLKNGKLPLTKTFLDTHIESRADWSKRKIRWAVESLCNAGGEPCVSAVQLMTGITPKAFKAFREFAIEYMNQFMYSNDS